MLPCILFYFFCVLHFIFSIRNQNTSALRTEIMNYEGLDGSFLIVFISKLLLNENSLKKNNCLEVVMGFQAGQIMKCDFNLMKLTFFCGFVSWLWQQLQKNSLELMNTLPVRGIFGSWKGAELGVKNPGLVCVVDIYLSTTYVPSTGMIENSKT